MCRSGIGYANPAFAAPARAGSPPWPGAPAPRFEPLSEDALATLDEKALRLQKEQAEAEGAAARMALSQMAGDERRATQLRKQGWTAQAALDRVRAIKCARQRRVEVDHRDWPRRAPYLCSFSLAFRSAAFHRL